MASTLATEKQAEAIKTRMAQIRTELPYAADLARDQAKQLADWRYHLARHPLPVLMGVAALGYLVVPEKKSRDRIIVDRFVPREPEPTKKGILGGLAGAVGAMLLKQIGSTAADQLARVVAQREKS